MAEIIDVIKEVLRDVCLFSERGSKIKLRHYQEGAARAIVDSVIHSRGFSFVVMFPRQSGKNELQAQIEAYLLTFFSQVDMEIVKVSPTWKPQSYNAMKRLERTLSKNLVTRKVWKKERDYIYRIDSASCKFLSGSPEANVVGATASLLLEVDEAQDILISKFDKDIAPMAASTNATRVFWGTAWTSKTLLHRELVAAREAEKRDGVQRTFVLTAMDVAAEVPAYGDFVAGQVAKMGRQNPMVKTQFFSEEIDGEGGMFGLVRVALMQGAQLPQVAPQAGRVYAMLLDVAGEDEGLQALDGELSNPGRDATALTIVEVDLVTVADAMIQAPTYRVVSRRLWVGVKHSRLYAEIKALADLWHIRFLVLDATGVGAGLASFLEKALPDKVIPFVFSGASKSKLGWDFLSIVDSGRWKEHLPFDGKFSLPGSNLWYQSTYVNELSFCQFSILPGPEHRMRWGVPDGMRDPATGELVHDDLVLSAALAGVLDEQEWTLAMPAAMIKAVDPLADMDRRNF